MATAFAVGNFSNQLFIVDLINGTFSPGPLLTSVPDGYSIIGLVYNCTNSTMYATLTNLSDTSIWKTAIVDTNSGMLSNVQDTPSTVDSIYSLAWNSALNQMFAYGSTSVIGGGPIMYTVDLDANVWTPLGSVFSQGQAGILYDCNQDILFGITGSNTLGGPQPNSIFEISPVDGTWTFVVSMSQTNFGDPFPAFDQSTNSVVFLSQTSNTTNPPQLFYVNTTTGQITTPLPGDTLNIPTGFAIQQPCCCLHEDTLLRLENGQSIRIADIRSGHIVIDFQGNPVQIENNARVGMSRQFIILPKNCLAADEPNMNLLIRKGHPLLLDGLEINCEELVGKVFGVEFIDLPERKSIFTLITNKKTYLNMNGCSVATWSQASFDQFTQHDRIGKSIFYEYQQ